MVRGTGVQSAREGLMASVSQRISNWLFPEEKSTIKDGLGEEVTVTSTHTGRTTLDTEQLYRSKEVQDFIETTRRDATPAG